jgi:uridine phosphorylase
MTKKEASRPKTPDNREYHLQTRPGDIAERCILVGDPARATFIAKKFFRHWERVGDHRGLLSYTGEYYGMRMSVVTTGMGAPSTGIVLPEACRSGARAFIRVGSCSTLLKKPRPGDAIIVTAAVRMEGASRNWAPIEYPAFATAELIVLMKQAADDVCRGKWHAGVEATTDCFNEGQSRMNVDAKLSSKSMERHDELIRLGVACYSMEASALFVWCATHCGGIPAGAVNAVYGNRITNAWMSHTQKIAGEEFAARIALDTLLDFCIR